MKRETIGTPDIAPPSVQGVGKPTLSDESVERVVTAMRLLKKDRFAGNGAALARALHLSQSTISDLENHKHKPSFVTAQRIAKMMGVQVWDLLGERPGVAATAETHPHLFEALAMLGDKCPPVARARVLAVAEQLPDFGLQTWVLMLVDPAHALPMASDQRTPPPVSGVTGPKMKSKP